MAREDELPEDQMTKASKKPRHDPVIAFFDKIAEERRRPLPALSVEGALAGEREQVALLAEQERAWIVLLQDLDGSSEPAPALFRELWTVKPDVARWIEAISLALGDLAGSSSKIEKRQRLWPWLRRSLASAFSEDHDAWMEFELQDSRLVVRDDGGFDHALRLHRRIVATDPGHRLRGPTALRVVEGAVTVSAHRAALDHALDAAEAFRRRGDASGEDLAIRRAAGAHMALRQWDEAFELLDARMDRTRQLRSGVSVLPSHTEPEDRAIGDARDVASWAAWTTPEWVRALGVLSEAVQDFVARKKILVRFETALARMVEQDVEGSGVAVAAEQLRERGHLRLATRVQRSHPPTEPDRT